MRLGIHGTSTTLLQTSDGSQEGKGERSQAAYYSRAAAFHTPFDRRADAVFEATCEKDFSLQVSSALPAAFMPASQGYHPTLPGMVVIENNKRSAEERNTINTEEQREGCGITVNDKMYLQVFHFKPLNLHLVYVALF